MFAAGYDMPAESAKPADQQEKLWTLGRVLQVVVFITIWIGGMFAAAGTMWWLRGWIFTVCILALYAGATVRVTLKNPALIPARAKWHYREMRPFDRVFIGLLFPLYLGQPVVAGLDAVRYRWTSMPLWTAYAGLIFLACGLVIMTWAMEVNRFAEPVVRIQKERGQTPVTTGPYRYVRHPIYVGAIVMFTATGLTLGSWWAVAVGGVLSLLVVWRTAMEDRVLLRELPGYEEFAAITRYRLVPGVW
jgi:protein-S-isoprenylcysteine O-methyltransferase Ste14